MEHLKQNTHNQVNIVLVKQVVASCQKKEEKKNQEVNFVGKS